MADLQKLPIQAKEVIGTEVYAVPTVTERVPSGRSMFEPYRIFSVSGDKQQDIQVRVTGLDNSFVPNKLTKVTNDGGRQRAISRENQARNHFYC